mmetsp:Transcript_21692/g.38772  ORF Transcript_21692/g.38772 Transcript_21692/m.38772 type:complete len:231 (+) Transcript_21692:1051-1743(+)
MEGKTITPSSVSANHPLDLIVSSALASGKNGRANKTGHSTTPEARHTVRSNDAADNTHRGVRHRRIATSGLKTSLNKLNRAGDGSGQTTTETTRKNFHLERRIPVITNYGSLNRSVKTETGAAEEETTGERRTETTPKSENTLVLNDTNTSSDHAGTLFTSGKIPSSHLHANLDHIEGIGGSVSDANTDTAGVKLSENRVGDLGLGGNSSAGLGGDLNSLLSSHISKVLV